MDFTAVSIDKPQLLVLISLLFELLSWTLSLKIAFTVEAETLTEAWTEMTTGE